MARSDEKSHFWQSPEFKALQKTWYENLGNAGFTDIEKTVGDEQVLIQFASNAYRQAVETVREAKQQYYESLRQHTHEEQFTDPTHQLIMDRYSDGTEIRLIVAELTQMGKPIHRQTVRYIVRKYEMKWQLKIYKRTQIYSRCKVK